MHPDATEDEIAAALIDEHVRAVPPEQRDAGMKVLGIRYRQPERAWRVVLSLVRQAPDDLLEWVGVGEMENFLHLHATEFIEEIEEQAACDPRFAEALSCVWMSTGIHAPEIDERLLRASGGTVLYLGPIDEELRASMESHRTRRGAEPESR